jgi:hypothetical protein
VAGVTNHTNKYTVAAQWLIVRLNTGGTLDTTFDVDGILILDPHFGGVDEVNDRTHDILVRPDGKASRVAGD